MPDSAKRPGKTSPVSIGYNFEMKICGVNSRFFLFLDPPPFLKTSIPRYRKCKCSSPCQVSHLLFCYPSLTSISKPVTEWKKFTARPKSAPSVTKLIADLDWNQVQSFWNCWNLRHNFSVGTFVEITEIMRKSRNFDELKWVWHQWHDQSGGKMRGDYSRFVQLSNEAARMNSNIQFITIFMSEVTCCFPRL